jgi:hypothetical protein
MGTRSAIGFVEFDGSVTAIYCHWDGYLEGVGQTLVKHYNDTYKVLDLLDMGDVSVIGATLDTSTFYKRDRKEENTDCKDFLNVADFIGEMADYGCEYFYLYDGVEWSWSNGGLNGFKPVPMIVQA